jgi:hypothetical protein
MSPLFFFGIMDRRMPPFQQILPKSLRPPGHRAYSFGPREESMDQEELQEFSGAPGTSVPQVDPSDVKAAWVLAQETKKAHPDNVVGVGEEIFEARCTPGANVQAVFYRTNMIGLLQLVMPELVNPLVQAKLNAVFQTAATIPMEWMESGIVRRDLPFDADDFVRRVREAA